MLGPIRWIVCIVMRVVLSLRYRVTLHGLPEVLAKPGPYLILPNHPAYADPPNMLARLWLSFKMRPLFLETNFHNPVLAPFAYRAATAVRGHIDASRARRIGVGIEQLGEFSGHGAALSARIAGLEPALAQMEPTHLAPADVEFRLATTARLAELSTAVHAAERMPTPRRKGAHRSIGADLDRIDAELLRKLGVR